MMDRFEKFSPTKIVFGENKLKELPKLLPKGSKKILIVTGKKSSKINNSLSLIESLLKEQGKQYFIFDKVEQNPSAETINTGASLARKHNIDTVIGLGGGSPMDTAKCISLLAKNDGTIEDHLVGAQYIEPLHPFAFLIAIPTTAGSGSEVDQHAVISLSTKGRGDLAPTKKGFSHTNNFPKVAILDPLLTTTMPYEITVNTGIDALTHAIEGYLSTEATADTDKLAIEAIKIIKDTLPELAKTMGEETSPLRAKMLYASMLGGLIIANTGTIILHALGYPLTVFYDVPHGRANGALLPVALDFLKDTQKEKIDKIFQIFDKPALLGFLSDLGISTKLCDYGVSESDIPRFVNDVWGRRNLNYTAKEVTKEDISLLYTATIME